MIKPMVIPAMSPFARRFDALNLDVGMCCGLPPSSRSDGGGDGCNWSRIGSSR
jgi:hypothetical protein